MIKNLFTNTILFALFATLLAAPFIPAKLIKYYPQQNILSASSKNDKNLITIENVEELSKILELTVFPHQFAYYEKILELRNFSPKTASYKVETFIKEGNAQVEAVFNNNEKEITLHPNEKTYIDIKGLGTKDDIERVKVFLEISAKNVQQ